MIMLTKYERTFIIKPKLAGKDNTVNYHRSRKHQATSSFPTAVNFTISCSTFYPETDSNLTYIDTVMSVLLYHDLSFGAQRRQHSDH